VFGYRCEPAACRDARPSLAGSHVVLGAGAARWEQERGAKDLQGCLSHFVTQPTAGIKCVSSRLGSSGTERAQSGSSVNLKLFLLLNSPLLCLLGNEE